MSDTLGRVLPFSPREPRAWNRDVDEEIVAQDCARELAALTARLRATLTVERLEFVGDLDPDEGATE